MNEEMTMAQLLSKVTDLEQRVAYLEQQMKIQPLPASSIPEASSFLPYVDPMWQQSDLTEVRELIRRGRKIDAIKRYRELKNCGLREAKDAVDAIERGR